MRENVVWCRYGEVGAFLGVTRREEEEDGEGGIQRSPLDEASNEVSR